MSIDNIKTNKRIALLLLAAGRSKRVGTPKQLLKFNEVPMLQLVLDNVLGGNYDVYVVTGAYRAKILAAINIEGAEEVYNANWQEGMGSSIREGLKATLTYHDYNGVIISVADQIFLTREVLEELILKHNANPDHIIASSYGKGFGPPVLFPRSMFSYLKSLNGDEGARLIITKNLNKVVLHEFPEGKIDIDSLEDYENYK